MIAALAIMSVCCAFLAVAAGALYEEKHRRKDAVLAFILAISATGFGYWSGTLA